MGNRRRRERRIGAAAALERQDVPRLLHGAVRGTAAAAPAALSAQVRTRLRGAVRSEVRVCSAGARARAETPVRRKVHRAVRGPVDGEAGIGGARSVAAMSGDKTRSRGSPRNEVRGEHRDECGAQRRREENAAAPVTMQSDWMSTVPARQRRRAQRAAGQASARSARRARRREGSQRYRREAAIGAESPVAKRRAQTHRSVRHTAHHRLHQRQHQEHRQRRRHRRAYRRHRRTRKRARETSGGAAAKRVAAGDVRREGEPCERWLGIV